MRLKLDWENYGKWILIGATVLVWLVIIILFKVHGYWESWALWNVPTWKIPFLDFRLIPGSADSFRHGFEPSLENPYDPTHRIFNYPAFWRLFFYTGITQADTIWISITMIVLFFIGVFLFPGKLSIPGVIAMLTVMFSPASMLLYERGNVDLIVFFVCALIVFVESYSANGAALLIAFGSIMKLFPFLGVSVLLKESKNKFWTLFAGCFLVLVVYMVATWSSVKASWNLTMRGDDLSYGTNILVTRYQVAITNFLSQRYSPTQVHWLVNYGMLSVALVLLAVTVFLAFRNGQGPAVLDERNLAAFRMGASIYVGTFLLGNNWDYRLAFLVLLVPQLVDWMFTSNKTYRLLAWIAILLVLASCWHLVISEISLKSFLGTMRATRKFWLVADEIFNWLLFLDLGYLFVVSLPDWLKDQVSSLYPKRKVVASTPTI
jgi:hypothetical protein